MRVISVSLTVALLCSFCLYGAGELSNRRAPGFSLMDSAGRQYDLQDYRGKFLLLEIMQTNCPHCRTFSKVLDKVKAKYGDRLAILSVVNPPDTPQTVSQFVKEVNPPGPILFDCGQMAISYFRVTPQHPSVDIPHVFIIDGNGWVVNDFAYGPPNMSFFTGEALFTELDRLLAVKKK